MVDLISKIFHRNESSSLGQEARKADKLKEFGNQFQESYIVASVLFEEGFYTFGSERSYDVFKRNLFYGVTALDASGDGIPLLFITNWTLGLPGVSVKSPPSFLIYKFMLQRSDESPIESYPDVLIEKDGFRLYRVPVCNIYQQKDLDHTKYKFVFHGRGEKSKVSFMEMSASCRDISSQINGMRSTWYFCTSIVNEHDDYKLQINTSDHNNTSKVQRKVTSTEGIAAYYTRALNDFSFRKSYKVANIYVGPKSNNPLHKDYQTTELITCQALLVHYVEYRKRERKAFHRANQACWYMTGFGMP